MRAVPPAAHAPSRTCARRSVRARPTRRPRASSSSRGRSREAALAVRHEARGPGRRKENGDREVGTDVTKNVPDCPPWLSRFREEGPRMPVPPMFRPEPGARPAAVLILFGEGPDGPDVLLTERAATLNNHAGQSGRASLPESGDRWP